MPRSGRIVLPNTSHHIVQRGHNRSTVFYTVTDFRIYLDSLLETKESLGCRLYAYCLMDNHVHLIVDPGDEPDNLALLMKSIASRQTRYVNGCKHRSGTLWEGRYRSSAIETDRYLLVCSRYVETNPVRARMVSRPEDYPWSSYLYKVTTTGSPLVDLDPCYLALADSPADRAARYRAFVDAEVVDHDHRLIREAVQRGQLTGGNQFVDEVQSRIGKRVERRGRGRPKGK